MTEEKLKCSKTNCLFIGPRSKMKAILDSDRISSNLHCPLCLNTEFVKIPKDKQFTEKKAEELSAGDYFKIAFQKKWRKVKRVIILSPGENVPNNLENKVLIVLDNSKQAVCDKGTVVAVADYPEIACTQIKK